MSVLLDGDTERTLKMADDLKRGQNSHGLSVEGFSEVSCVLEGVTAVLPDFLRSVDILRVEAKETNIALTIYSEDIFNLQSTFTKEMMHGEREGVIKMLRTGKNALANAKRDYLKLRKEISEQGARND